MYAEDEQVRFPNRPKAARCRFCGVSTRSALYIGITYVEEAWNGGVVRRTHTWECDNCEGQFHEDIRE